MTLDLTESWQTLMDGLGVASAAHEPVLSDLLSRYAEPHRHYHTTVHLHSVLGWLGELWQPDIVPAASQLAAWYHDAIYDPRRSDNEAASAALACRQLSQLALPNHIISQSATLIRLTGTHNSDEADRAGCRLLDADLAILGASRARYHTYALAIRQEYDWVEEHLYRSERRRILSTFLARPFIYSTIWMRAAREEKARDNMEWERRALLEGVLTQRTT